MATRPAVGTPGREPGAPFHLWPKGTMTRKPPLGQICPILSDGFKGSLLSTWGATLQIPREQPRTGSRSLCVSPSPRNGGWKGVGKPTTSLRRLQTVLTQPVPMLTPWNHPTKWQLQKGGSRGPSGIPLLSPGGLNHLWVTGTGLVLMTAQPRTWPCQLCLNKALCAEALPFSLPAMNGLSGGQKGTQSH